MEKVGFEMTEQELLELCNTDFVTKIDKILNEAKRDFVRQVKSDVIDYIAEVTISQRERSRRSSIQSNRVSDAQSQISQHEILDQGDLDDEFVYEDNRVIPEEEEDKVIVSDELVDEHMYDFAADSANMIGGFSEEGIVMDGFDGAPHNISPVESRNSDEFVGNDEEESDFLGFADSQAFD